MSKAFTREDDQPDQPVVARRLSPLPPGTRNLTTAGGARRMREEISRLQAERDQLAGREKDPAVLQSLATLDQRIRNLDESLQTVVIVPPPTTPDQVVRFGATVTVRESDASTSSYQIVGVDEVDLDRNCISWLSPLAKALLNRRAGDRVRLQAPGGERKLEIVAVTHS